MLFRYLQGPPHSIWYAEVSGSRTREIAERWSDIPRDLERMGHPISGSSKGDGRVRLCGDFKVSVNPALKIDQYPLPKVEDMFATLGKSTVFSKVDLKLAYLQLELEEEAKKLVAVNTHKGLFRYNRLPFGIASAPAIWQRTMDLILQGIPKLQCLMDDIIVAGEEEHLALLEKVLQRLDQRNLTGNKEKRNSITTCTDTTSL